MEYVIYQGKKIQSYDLLHNGEIRHIPFLFSEERAHKIIDRIERNERMWEWMFTNDWKVALVMVALGLPLVVLWGM